MRYRALVLLGIAVVLGGLAAYLVNSIVTQEIAQQGEMVPQVVRPAVVASVDIPVGTTLEPTLLRVVDMPVNAYPEGSYSSVEAAVGTEPSVVLVNLSAGEVILPSKLSGGVLRSGLTARIPDGARAIAIPVDEIRGVGGFVLPGDRVDVLHTTNVGRRDGRLVTRTLLQDRLVLGVDQISSENEEDPVVVNAVTLLVDPEDAKKLTLAQQVGTLTLSLRNEGDGGNDGSSTIALNDLWSLEPGERLAPAATTGTTSTASTTQTGPRRSVEVIRGLEIEQETVSPGPAVADTADDDD